ncbi:prephenate dehydratase [Candidatus Formimonas warabiya]|uniref:Prephenate dehydratase n=1 Tax=Formimonas warabiya TaxID=1761012 RepID=A0A3G1KRS0_FORW1|nr:prephenate dehydratase [Candidatus Formimonas warabiya]ATW25183.1 hypothetical protein DCMF_10740 [Candidatus Formimonas warabiya]
MPNQTIGFLGPSGTFCEMAAETLFPAGHLTACVNLISVIEGVASGNLTTGVLPMENLLEGTVTPVLDGLTSYQDVKISGELVLPVQHHLLVNQGVKKDEITAVFSHSHALAQCQDYLRKRLPAIPCHAVSSTAEAARRVALELHSCAAIGNKRAAKIYGLHILEESISDGAENFTRFVILKKEITGPTGHDKTSIAFSLEHQPGTLASMLVLFAQAGINLTKIESRPSRKVLGEYIFYVDFEGHQEDEEVQRVLHQAKQHTTFLSVMGSYPRNS